MTLSLADKLESYCCHHTGKEWPNLPVCAKPKKRRGKRTIGSRGIKEGKRIREKNTKKMKKEEVEGKYKGKKSKKKGEKKEAGWG